MLTELMKDLGFAGHSTEFNGLAPHQQNMLEQARSVIESLGDDPTVVLGQPDGRKLVKYYFAAIDQTGAKAQEMGMSSIPEIAFLGNPVDKGEVPGPVMFTIEGKRTRQVAVVYIRYNKADAWSGYGDLYTADWYVDKMCDDFDQAKARVQEMAQAVRILKQAARDIQRAQARVNDTADDIDF